MNIEVISALADEVERLQELHSEEDLGHRISHHVHLHFGFDDTREEVPAELFADFMELICAVKVELERRRRQRKHDLFGEKVIETPDGLVPVEELCHRGCRL